MLFRGNAEGDIRKNLVRKGYLKGIIGLPPNLFYGTGIPACIVVIDKEHANARKGVFAVDASRGLLKDGNKNRLREQDIHRIVDVFTRQLDVPGYSRRVLSAVTLPVPSIDEQIAIATALSDMDCEMAALGAKLAKARQLKQGMMQNLRTGKIRLVSPATD